MKIKIAIFLLAVSWRTVESDDKFNTSWSLFLEKLSDYLSGPTIQRDVKRYLVNDLNIWGNCSKTCYTVKNMPKKINETLMYINASYFIIEGINKLGKQTSKLKEGYTRQIIDKLIDTLTHVHKYKDTGLIKTLENSYHNFTNDTLKTVEQTLDNIQKQVLLTGCHKVYHKEQNHCIVANASGPPSITQENFRQFLFILKKADNKTFHGFICWANVELGKKQLNDVNTVLKVNLNETLDHNCKGNRSIFSGNIVRISEIHLNTDRKCNKSESDGEIVQIMASNTIYIDEDINFTGRRVLLAIMAPTVVVVGDRKIWLGGLDENSGTKLPRGLENFENFTYGYGRTMFKNMDSKFLHGLIKSIIIDEAVSNIVAPPAVFWSNHFERKALTKYYNETIDSPHGAPGLPGHTGGSFFGLADVFENSSKLSIISYGGRGGYGQHGAHGKRGVRGEISRVLNGNIMPCIGCEKQEIDWKDGDGEFPNVYYEYVPKSATSAFFYGRQGTKGTDGGDGGAGGLGGDPGEIRIITLKRNDSFTKYALKGDTGIPGLAGSGGTGGYTPKQNVEVIVPAVNLATRVIVVPALRYEQSFDSGKEGIDGNNTQGQQPPSPAIDISTNLDPLITDYRRMLKNNLETFIPTKKIFDHLMAVLKHTQIVGNCSTLSVVNELLEYEDSFYRLHKKFDYTKLYSILLNYTETKVERVEERDDKRALHYTYTAILSKLHAIKNHKEEKYIANLNHFLNMFVEKLNRYKEKKREIAIIEESERYKADIDKQIEDANNVVSNSIMPKLEEIFAQLDRDLEELKREVDQKEQELLAQRKKLEKQKEEMKKNWLVRLFGNILKVVGAIVSCLGPIGMAVGGAMQIAGTLVNKFGVNQEAYKQPPIADLHVKLGGVINTFEAANKQKEIIIKNIDNALNMFTSKNTAFGKEYNRAKEIYGNVKENIEDVKKSFTYIKDTYNKAINDLQDMKKTVRSFISFNGDAYKQCKEVYTKVEAAFSSTSSFGKFIFNKANDVLKKLTVNNVVQKVASLIPKGAEFLKNSLSSVSTAFKSASGVFSQFTGFAIKGINIMQSVGSLAADLNEDNAQLEEIDRALAENQKSLDAIRKYREAIDEHMKPMLEGMKNTIRQFPAMCAGKSEAQLMTKGWEVEQFLDKIISTMNQMTKEFQVGESFKTTITSIKEAVSLMTNIFRKIQDYGDKKKLSNHIAKLHLAGSEIQIEDEELRKVTIRLSAAIEANLLLFDYRVWLKQIRLFIFPLPDTYLNTFKVPTAFESDDAHTLDGYTTKAIKAVERFRAQYIESNVYINKFDKLKHRAFFYNDTQKGPFFVWKNKNHKRAISRLFAGESVVFEALTLRSGMNALKFRRIDLVIRTNKKNQTLLNDILKNYMVRMKHIGNNYYNCDNITYVATVVGQTFKFSYQYINREPVDINVVYDKILHGDYMLSPYTTWYIKLINEDRKSYQRLREFQRDVDIELSGEGEYFEDRSEVCEDDLSEYYQTRDQFKKKKRKVYEECPAFAIVKKGFLCCEFNDTFDPVDKYWCRAIVRKPETLEKVHNTSEDKHYYYYDRYFRRSALSEDDLKTKFRANCSLHHGNRKCIEAFKNRQAYRPWFFYHDKAGGPFSRSYLYCSGNQCLARIEKALGPLEGLPYTNENAKYYFYAKPFNERYIKGEDRKKFERCSPSDADCAPAFENSSLLNFRWAGLPEKFHKQEEDDKQKFMNIHLMLKKYTKPIKSPGPYFV